MNPYQAYQQQSHQGWLRIDALLALYDGTIERVEKALAALRKYDRAGAKPHIEKARLLVGAMVSAVDQGRGEEIGKQFLRLYEFVFHSLTVGRVKDLESALKVLNTLRDGLQEIRPQAAQMERDGQIPSLEGGPRVQLKV